MFEYLQRHIDSFTTRLKQSPINDSFVSSIVVIPTLTFTFILSLIIAQVKVGRKQLKNKNQRATSLTYTFSRSRNTCHKLRIPSLIKHYYGRNGSRFM